MVLLYFGGIVVGVLAALLLKSTVFQGEAVPFVMELPNYRLQMCIRDRVRMSSIIMPPPAPIKPQIKPMSTPHTTDCTARFWGLTTSMASLVVCLLYTSSCV